MKSKPWIAAALLAALAMLLLAATRGADHFGCHAHGAAIHHCH